MPLESDLYPPVKALLESQGYVVKGEVAHCDVVGVRDDGPPVIVELKRAFNLGLLLQGVDRLALTDSVYLAIGRIPKQSKEIRTLCRRLGLGLIVVTGQRAEVLLDPAPYAPRKNTRKVGRLLGEHARRVGDPNLGGSSTRVPMMTSYRQEALRCAELLAPGPMTLAQMRAAADVPHAAAIVQKDYYGWFERVARGTYALTPVGHQGIARYAADVTR
ncbi:MULTISPECIES: DUF2161 domain-containing phosphodiesterase [Mycolicibacterium]|jgi:hypothetical protein|uniref:Uncharacterized conserved protein n=2 Tax=Mycolicibacterium TaxID=1866885 RepID=A0A378TBS8_9MYCO|nr:MULTISPECIES: DUF2161 family putative PD-(D/E)XK-type phosphodiesterase [Mycolicibacterium]ANW64499.1 hypothetical protein BCA37_13660 [Mycobacterium sp. djl-10]MCV7186630.1 hypothetical protein [Mycolicibacterium murale]STZ56966.1 Uncharacterized conserved protein [Mycolicibacterium tokaiense]BBY88512.1 hypothetical protein MTOK_42940 [Mycolicibacterium tokaiense]GFG60166.1 hypothetical protein MMUR_43020 [Mycolicibacterium murale]